MVISPDYLASQFTLFEKNLYLSLSTQRDQPRRIIPLLLKGTVDLPPILATYTPISFAKEDERESSMQLLLNVLDAPHKNAVKQNVPVRSSQSKHYDTSVIRTMLDEAFDNDELMDFIFDHFRPLYDQFSPGTPKKNPIQNLIAYAEEKNLFESLLDYVARKKPRQYRRFAGKLEIDE